MVNVNTTRIKCAAILYDGIIYKGRSHSEIGRRMINTGVCSRPFPGGKSQGFFTTSGWYAERDVAMRLAIAAGQVAEGDTIHATELFSEDL